MTATGVVTAFYENIWNRGDLSWIPALLGEDARTGLLADVSVGLMYEAIEPLGKLLGTLPVGPEVAPRLAAR